MVCRPQRVHRHATGALSLAEPVAGGYRVTDVGRSAAAPGMPPDSWGLAAVKDGSGNSQAPTCCYFAREHVTVHDTWHVSGLRGTGSRPRSRAGEGRGRPAEREHRQQAVDKAQSALDKAEREHAERAEAF